MEGAILILVVGCVLYFVPTIVAVNRKKANTAAIVIVNLFFGWTLIGWVIALVWAVSKQVIDAPAGQPLLCKACGTFSPPSSKFCAQCASALEMPAKSLDGTAPARKPVSAAGTLKVAAFILFGLVVVGAVIAAGRKQREATHQQDNRGWVELAHQAASSQPPERRAPQWTKVRAWSGNGIKTTDNFDVSGKQWRVSWAAKNSGDIAGLIQVYVYDAANNLVTLAANKQGNGSDTSYIHGNNGPYHLMVNSGGMDWTVTVEDQR